jgi:sterol 24-C-methyltransferase
MSKSYLDQTQDYIGLHDGSVEARKASYATLVNHYYDLATDFYLFGWGESFHFARRHAGESFRESIRRHQLYLAHRLDMRRGQRVIDIGCGVAGPLSALVRATGAHIIGVNNNEYQLAKGRRAVARAGLEGLCELVHGDFMALPFGAGEIDAAYAIEATCHAPDREALFREILRVLRPGALFASYEWCMTDRFEAGSAEHQRMKRAIERGDGLPDLVGMSEVGDAARRAGFEVLDLHDVALDCDPATPWYLPLTGRDRSLGSLTRRPLARAITRRMVGVLEAARIAPKGASQVSDFLNEAADALVEGGRIGIFTPMAFLLVKKPGICADGQPVLR